MKLTRPVFLAAMTMASTLSVPLTVLAEEQKPIIVTATRTAQTVDETISPVIVIDRTEIESNPSAEVSDLLRMHAGIDIGRSGGPGQQTSVFIRGANSAHTLVLIDGVSINPDIGNAALQNIRLDMIERIEIVKGPRSTLYGSQAIGGVINIITRRPEGTHYEIHAGAGSYATKKYGFSAHNQNAESAAGITVDVSRSVGFPTIKTKTNDRGYRNLSLNLYGKKKMGVTDLEITHNHSSGKTDYTNIYSTPQDIDQNFTNNLTAIGINNTPATNWASKLKLSHMEDTIEQNQNNNISRTQRNALDWQNDIQINDKNLMTAGFYAAHENAKSVSSSSFHKNTQHYAAFIQDDMQAGAHHIIAGARTNNYSAFGNHTTYNLEYGFAINNQIQLNLAHNTGYRAPSATDRFGFGGNLNLLPEESKNSEFGIRYALSKQQNIHINYFQNDITNLIEYDSGTSKMQNIAAARIKGTEIEYNYHSENWMIDASAVFQNPENRKDGAQLSRRTKNSYSLGINRKINKNNIGIDVLYAGERDDSAYNSTILKSYTLANLKAHFQASKNLSINARVENLTDEVYELASTYRSPARSYYAELVYNFD